MAVIDSIKTAKEKVRRYMYAGIPCYLEGPPGVGKSECIEQITTEEKIGFIDTRAAQMDPVDLRGLPHNEKVNGHVITTWSRPDFLPDAQRHGEKGIWLLDELADCTKAMQSACYQPILNHCVGPHKIPPGWYICGAGNSQKHRAGAQAMSSALANRFAHITVEADWDCFREYGARNGLNPIIIGFTKQRPNMLHNMDGFVAGEKAFPSPRSWFKASLVCDAPSNMRMGLIAGCVGEAAAAEFEGFLRTVDLPDIDDICANPKKCHIPEQPSHKYALTTMLAQHATLSNFDKICIYISRPEFGRDFEVCVMLDASKRDESLAATAAFTAFANRNLSLVVN